MQNAECRMQNFGIFASQMDFIKNKKDVSAVAAEMVRGVCFREHTVRPYDGWGASIRSRGDGERRSLAGAASYSPTTVGGRPSVAVEC